MVIMLRKVLFKDVPIEEDFIFQGENHTKLTDSIAKDYQGIKKIFANDKEVFRIERKLDNDNM